MSSFTAIDENKKQTRLLITGFVALITALGAILGVGIYFASDKHSMNTVVLSASAFLLFALIYTSLVYLFMSRAINKIVGGEVATEEDFPKLNNIVEEMSLAAGLPKPKVYVVSEDAPNAFATGTKPEKASITVTTGLLSMMNRTELEGVIGHEMSHIKNYDIRVTSLTVALTMFIVNAGAWLSSAYYFRTSRSKDDSNSILLIIVLVGFIIQLIGIPIAKVLQFAVSRQREYLADVSSTELTQNPQGLISALAKISETPVKEDKFTSSSVSALYIAPPYIKNRKGRTRVNLLATHPDTADRIDRLRKL